MNLQENFPNGALPCLIPPFAKLKDMPQARRQTINPDSLAEGGITTKIHLLCTSDGKPLDLLITGGNVSDIKAAPEVTGRNQMKVLIADKAYGSKAYRAMLASKCIRVYIPPKCNEKILRFFVPPVSKIYKIMNSRMF